jgi:filamentous hemagglutinin family protein
MRMLRTGIGLLAWGLALPALAEVVTDGTVGPRVHLSGPEFAIGADLGTQAGPNLFHSFEKFSLANGERATFSGAGDIHNIISRVTGGIRSDIDGTIRSTIPGADFYFINPKGVVFGPNARLDVQGSFHVSTADELRFADGAKFSARTPSSSFTVAAPEAFGFLDRYRGALRVRDSRLKVRPGRAISLVGGDVAIAGGSADPDHPTIGASRGTITVAAVGPGEGQFGIRSGRLEAPDLGAITITDGAFLDTTGNGGGLIRIRGGRVVVQGGSAIFSNNDGGRDAPPGNGVDVDARILRVRGGSFLTADVTGERGGRGGTVSVRADRLEISGGSRLKADTFGDGDAGGVAVEAGRLLIDGNGAPTGITSDSQLFFTSDGQVMTAAGRAGEITVRAGQLQIRNAGVISSTTVGSAAAGPVTVEADRLLIDSGGSRSLTGVASDAGALSNIGLLLAPGQGSAGPVSVTADRIVLGGSATIHSQVIGDGPSGAVTIHARHITMSDFSSIRSEATSALLLNGQAVVSNADTTGVTITADTLQMSGSSQISSSVAGDGTAGPIVVRSSSIDMEGDEGNLATGILSEAAARTAGDVIISLSNGNAGKVTVIADDISIRNAARISTNVVGDGQAGDVMVHTGRLEIKNEHHLREDTGVVSDASNTLLHNIVVASSDGTAGLVTIVADRVEVGAFGEISSVTVGAGDSGTVEVRAPTIIVRDRGQISTSAAGTGRAGTVIVRAADRLLLDGGTIRTDSASAGGGQIRLEVGEVIDLRSSGITTSVIGGDDPTAGNITIDPKILIIDGGTIQANAPVGFGGLLRIDADNTVVPGGDFQALLDRGDISATGGDPTRNGTIVVNAPEVDLSGGFVVLQGAFLDTAPLRARCGARRDIGASSFTGVGQGGLPPSPDGPLPSTHFGLAVGDAKGQAGFEPTGEAGSGSNSAGLAPPCRPWN